MLGEPVVQLLGPLRVVCGGRELALGGTKPRAILAALALRANATVPTGRLAEQVWADPPGTAIRILQVHVSNLRRAMGSCEGIRIVGTTTGYRLELPAGALDLDRFEEHVGAGRVALERGDPAAAVRRFRAALELVTDAPLADLRDVGDLAHAATQLDDAVLAAREDLAEARILSGDHRRVLGELGELTDAHPYRERFAAYRMWALYLAGRQAEALDVYASTRRRLVEELGVEPGPELTRMHRDVLDQSPGLEVLPVDPLAAALPRPARRLIGRQDELRRLVELLRSATGGIVAVVGAGGCGKTRLAVEAAQVVAPAFADGVRFVDLAPVRSPEELDAALATSLGMPPRLTGSAGTAVRRWLAAHHVLLVLDTVEHLGAADELGRLAAASERSRLLVTSRLPLALREQVELRLRPLPVPDPDAGPDELEAAPAAALFLDRVREHRDVVLGPRTCEAVVRICRRLDGLPLALELAATRSEETDVVGIVEHLDDDGFLRTDGRDVPARQRTLGAALTWTIELLSPDSRTLLDTIGVFRGSSFDEEALAAVAPPSWDAPRLRGAVGTLLDASLLRRDDRGRYVALETALAEARRRLSATGRADEVRRRHAEHYLARIAALRDEARTPQEPVAAAVVHLDRHELTSAIAWCRESGDHVAAADATLDLTRFWRRAGHVELEADSLHPLLAHVDALPPDRRFGVAWCAGTWFAERDRSASERWLRLAVDLAEGIDDPRPPLGVVLTQLAQVLTIGGREREALSYAEAAVAATGDQGGVPYAFALFAAGWAHHCLGDRDTATSMARSSLEAAAGTGTWRAWPTLLLSRIALLDGRAGQAVELADEVRVLAEDADDRPLRAAAAAHLGWATHAAGDPQTALRWWRDTLQLAHRLQRPFTVGNALQGVGAELAQTGDRATAVRLWGAADALQRAIGVVDAHENRALYGELRRRVLAELGDHARTLSAAGAAMTLDEAVALGSGRASRS